jgi:hypothetical protein
MFLRKWQTTCNWIIDKIWLQYLNNMNNMVNRFPFLQRVHHFLICHVRQSLKNSLFAVADPHFLECVGISMVLFFFFWDRDLERKQTNSSFSVCTCMAHLKKLIQSNSGLNSMIMMMEFKFQYLKNYKKKLILK